VGGSYDVSGTIGQLVAGQRTGGSYTLQEGFWEAEGQIIVLPGGPVYLRLIAKLVPVPTPNPPVSCNEHEDNAGKTMPIPSSVDHGSVTKNCGPCCAIRTRTGYAPNVPDMSRAGDKI
jgi:hypothetical protein